MFKDDPKLYEQYYQLEENEDKLTALCLAAGLPNEEFDWAERTYKQEVVKNGKGYKYTLEGQR